MEDTDDASGEWQYLSVDVEPATTDVTSLKEPRIATSSVVPTVEYDPETKTLSLLFRG